MSSEFTVRLVFKHGAASEVVVFQKVIFAAGLHRARLRQGTDDDVTPQQPRQCSSQQVEHFERNSIQPPAKQRQRAACNNPG